MQFEEHKPDYILFRNGWMVRKGRYPYIYKKHHEQEINKNITVGKKGKTVTFFGHLLQIIMILQHGHNEVGSNLWRSYKYECHPNS
jgi:hypothetical protein